MLPILLLIVLNVDSSDSYIHAVPSINKDTVYVYNGYMCELYLDLWKITDPSQEIQQALEEFIYDIDGLKVKNIRVTLED